jgi:hypothetical protein
MIREEVSSKPVQTYTAVVPDELNDFEFSVRMYETPLRFRYLAKVRYKMIDAIDSVDIPNLGFQPQVEVRKRENDLSCMIGFLDKDGTFKDLKKVEVVDNQLKIRQVKRYGVGVVKKSSASK